MPSFKACPGCGNPIRTNAELCLSCHSAKRKTDAKERWESKFNIPIQSFEPQAVPVAEEPWGGRPWDDPRNNFKMPSPDMGPKRDLDISPVRVCLWDVETTDLWASMGRVLCSVMRFFSPDETIVRRADDYPAWKAGKRSDDSAIVLDILKDLEKADIIIAHNGLNFDSAFIRSRGIVHGMPPVHNKKIFDPVLIARRTFRFKSNRLDHLARQMGCPAEKTDVDMSLWAAAMLDGDKAAMDEIVHHCILDVDVLAWVSRKMAPYVKSFDQLGSFRG